MEWEYFREEGQWECFSTIHDGDGHHFRWVITVQQNGDFDLKNSSEELGVDDRTFPTLVAAGRFAAMQEAKLADDCNIDKQGSHRHNWQKVIGQGTLVCECGAWK